MPSKGVIISMAITVAVVLSVLAAINRIEKLKPIKDIVNP
jgi:hypothetical protein